MNKRMLKQFRKSFTFAGPGGEIKIVLGGTALILAFPKEQNLAWVSAGGAAAL